MSTLREKMKQEMILVGLAKSTQAIYLKAVIDLHDYYNKSPTKLSESEIKTYLLYLKQEKKLAPNTYNTQIYGLRFFYCITLRQPLFRLNLPTTKVTYKLPDILSSDEVQKIIQSVKGIKYRTLLMVIYSAGLRVSEALNLKISDIDSDRMTLHIRCAKGGKDRYVILSPIVYSALRDYWKACKFKEIVFPSKRDKEKSLSASKALQIFKEAKRKAGVVKSGGIHSLRHAFATHLLEAGTDIFSIKTLLGHASIQSTVRYLDFVPNRHQNLISPIDRLSL
ncbi:MAG: integrase [Proteobacteria bacterium]|nr:integrase [Pseudomonadota bacterium]